MMYSHYLPFIEDEDNTIATFAQLEIYFVLTMGMLMQTSANLSGHVTHPLAFLLAFILAYS